MLFSPLQHYWDTDSVLKLSQCLYCFTTISHGVENYFPRLWGMGISDAIFEIGVRPPSCVHVGPSHYMHFCQHFCFQTQKTFQLINFKLDS